MSRKVMLLVAVMAVVLTAVSQGALITPTAWKNSNAYSADRSAAKLGLAAGMDPTQTYLYNQDGVGGIGETTSANGKEWCTSSNGDEALAASEGKVWIVADLGAIYALNTINIWNFNWDNTPGTPLTSLNDRGTKQFDIYVRNAEADTDTGLAGGTAINLNNTTYDQNTNLAIWFNVGTSNQWQLALSNQQLAQAPNNDTYAGESFNLTGKTGRFVAIVVDSHYGGTGMGLGKVRLDGVLVPEPATMGILLLGGLMGLRFRRK